MYLLVDHAKDFGALNEDAKNILKEIMAKASLKGEAVMLRATEDLYLEPETKGNLYLITEGSLYYKLDERVLFYYDEHDLVGLEHSWSSRGGKIGSQFAVKAMRYSADEFLKLVSGEGELLRLWNGYLSQQISLFTAVVRSFIKDGMVMEPATRLFKAGDTIIEQGAKTDEVYTLVSGHADVFVDKVKVGEILADEIFGAITGLAGTPRTATVIATADSLALVLPRDSFIQLIESRPATVLKLVEDMARAITSSNQKLVQMSAVIKG